MEDTTVRPNGKIARMIVQAGKGEPIDTRFPIIVIDDGSGENNKMRIAINIDKSIEENKERLVAWLIDGNYHLHIANWVGTTGEIPVEKAGRYIETVRMLHLAFVSLILSVGNDTDDQILGFKNCVKTLGVTAEKLVRGKGNGPAFIICSGPSFRWFEQERDACKITSKGLVIACDSALDSCLAVDLHPHLVVSIERYEEIARLFSKECYDVPLLSCPIQNKKVYDKFPRKIFMGNALSYVHKLHPSLAVVPIGPSCSTAAIVMGRCSGYDPVYLIGSDNAFHGDNHHGTKTPLDTKPSEKDFKRIVVNGRMTIYPWLKIRDWIDSNCGDGKYLRYEGIGLGYRHLAPVTWEEILKLPERKINIITKGESGNSNALVKIKETTEKMLEILKSGGPSALFSDNQPPYHKVIIELLSPSASTWYAVRSQSTSDAHTSKVDRDWAKEIKIHLEEIHEISSR